MSSNQYASPPPQNQSTLSFTQGLLLGQLSVVLLLGAFIKFFIFGEAPPPPSRSSLTSRTSTHKRSPSLHNFASSSSPPRSLRHKSSTNQVLRPVPSSSTNSASILRKTYYQTVTDPFSSKTTRQGQSHHSSHQPESLDWFNVLIAQTIAQYRQTAFTLRDSDGSNTSTILSTLTAALNSPEKKPFFLDSITITEISLGEEFPIFSNCRVIAVENEPSGSGGGSDGNSTRLQALMDVDLSDDNLTLAIETALILNYPKPFSAVLPLALAVSVVRFSGTLSISFIPPPSSSEDPAASASTSATTTTPPATQLAFSFLPDYRLELSVRSLVGSRSRLQDVPKIAQLVEARVCAWFEERVVEPRVQVVGLPGLWPRMGRTGVRGGSGGSEEEREGRERSASGRGREEEGTMGKDEDEGLRWRGGGGGEGGSAIQEEQRQEQPEEGLGLRMPGAMPGIVA